ncbi:MAG: sugar ABC transporter permease [Chloroflexi bacterium]|nr:sugar ABC transporter permease [Chloroflexota bacterium]
MNRANGQTSLGWWRRPASREAAFFYLCVSPWIVGFILFTAGPMLASILISLTSWDFISSPTYVGLSNYQAMLNDELFFKSLKVTTTYTLLSVPLGLAGGLLIALLMNQNLKGITIFRTIYYLPSVIAGVAVALLWQWIFNPNYGMINGILGLVGIDGPKWIYTEDWVIPAFVIMSLWGVGASMIIYLAALQSVPTELYEAAALDGAGAARRFQSITLPMISPVIFFNLIIGIINSFQIFTSVYIMTQGGPNNGSLFFVLYIYRHAFQYFNIGYASALAWVLFIVIMLFTLFIFRFSKAWVYYEGAAR